MSSYVFVIAIVAIGCATAVVNKFLQTRSEKTEDNQAIDETMAQLHALEERIRVLERIVTESRVDLKREIDRL